MSSAETALVPASLMNFDFFVKTVKKCGLMRLHVGVLVGKVMARMMRTVGQTTAI